MNFHFSLQSIADTAIHPSASAPFMLIQSAVRFHPPPPAVKAAAGVRRGSTLTAGDWTELQPPDNNNNNHQRAAGGKARRPDVRQLFGGSGSVDELIDESLRKEQLLKTLLLTTAQPTPRGDDVIDVRADDVMTTTAPSTPSSTHSPSDPGICMDSGSDDPATCIDEDSGSEDPVTDSAGDDDSHRNEDPAPKDLNVETGSDSAHSPSSSVSSPPASPAGSLSGFEEAVSLAYIDESRTVHKYIASRGQREREQGWKFMGCSHCQELGPQASWLLIGCTRMNNKSEARLASCSS